MRTPSAWQAARAWATFCWPTVCRPARGETTWANMLAPPNSLPVSVRGAMPRPRNQSHSHRTL